MNQKSDSPPLTDSIQQRADEGYLNDCYTIPLDCYSQVRCPCMESILFLVTNEHDNQAGVHPATEGDSINVMKKERGEMDALKR